MACCLAMWYTVHQDISHVILLLFTTLEAINSYGEVFSHILSLLSLALTSLRVELKQIMICWSPQHLAILVKSALISKIWYQCKMLLSMKRHYHLIPLWVVSCLRYICVLCVYYCVCPITFLFFPYLFVKQRYRCIRRNIIDPLRADLQCHFTKTDLGLFVNHLFPTLDFGHNL